MFYLKPVRLTCLIIFWLHRVTTGTPVVSLYTNQTVSGPAALAVAVLSSAVATGQSLPQSSAPLMVTSQPVPNLTSVPVSLNLTAQDTAAAHSVLTFSQPASSLSANSQDTVHLQSEGQATDSPPVSTVTTEEPTAVTSQVGCSLPPVV